jgi:hypothetical protein
MNRPLRKGNFNPLLFESFENPFPDNVLSQVLVHKFRYLTDNGKIKGTGAESGTESGIGLRISQ